MDLNLGFYPKLQEKINKKPSSTKDQWLIVGIKIGKENLLKSVQVASSINDTELEKRFYNIIRKMTNWATATINSKPVESDIYFSVFVVNNEITILAYYRHQKSSF